MQAESANSNSGIETVAADGRLAAGVPSDWSREMACAIIAWWDGSINIYQIISMQKQDSQILIFYRFQVTQ